MLTVHLEKSVFFAHHGLHDGENDTGNNFEVTLNVSYEEGRLHLNSLTGIISYEDLFHIVKKRMASPTPLLEELADSILRTIKHQFPMVKEISISIYKLTAPIEGLQGKVGITLQKKFED